MTGQDSQRYARFKTFPGVIAIVLPALLISLCSLPFGKAQYSDFDLGPCNMRWYHDFVPRCIGFRSGVPTPGSTHTSIRLDTSDINVYRHPKSCVVESVFVFFNPGETTREIVRFPKLGNVCIYTGKPLHYRLRRPEFISFNVWVNGRHVPLTDEIQLLRPQPGGEVDEAAERYAAGNSYIGWLTTRVVFPSNQPTVIRLRCETEYFYDEETWFILYTAAGWEGPVGHFSIVQDSSAFYSQNITFREQIIPKRDSLWTSPRALGAKRAVYRSKDLLIFEFKELHTDKLRLWYDSEYL